MGIDTEKGDLLKVRAILFFRLLRMCLEKGAVF